MRSIALDHEIIINYFLHRNLQRHGYQKFGYFQRLMEYKIKGVNQYRARKIFSVIKALGFVEKMASKHRYRFKNPYAHTPLVLGEIGSWD